MTNIQRLRDEYREIRRQTVQDVNDAAGDMYAQLDIEAYNNITFDRDVSARLTLLDLERTPENWVLAAKEWHYVAHMVEDTEWQLASKIGGYQKYRRSVTFALETPRSLIENFVEHEQLAWYDQEFDASILDDRYVALTKAVDDSGD